MNLQKLFYGIDRAFGFSVEDILGRSKKQPLASVRMLAVYLAREGRTLEQLGELFKRTHTNCMHSCKSISQRIETEDVQTLELFGKLKKELYNGHTNR